MNRLALLLLLSTLLGCAQGSAGGPAASRTITVQEALDAPQGQQQIAVRGYLLAHPDGRVLLCTGLAGSYPPQCGGPALTVRNLDVASLEDADHASGVTWTGQMTLRGTLRGTVLTFAAGHR